MKLYQSSFRCMTCDRYLHWGITASRRYVVQCEAPYCLWYRDPFEGATLGEAIERMNHGPKEEVR